MWSEIKICLWLVELIIILLELEEIGDNFDFFFWWIEKKRKIIYESWIVYIVECLNGN